MQCIVYYNTEYMLLTFIQLGKYFIKLLIRKLKIDSYCWHNRCITHTITIHQIYIREVWIYHWKFCITFFIWLNKVEVLQFFIIYIQIKLMFFFITQNVIFNLFISIFITLVAILISPGHIHITVKVLSNALLSFSVWGFCENK